MNGDIPDNPNIPGANRRQADLPRALPSIARASVLLYLAVVAILLVTILHRDDHVFTYTLDDPYIHLALADSIAHGHYGINPGEPSSPSSSILWPFLLVPFAAQAWSMYLPLLLNILFCAASAGLLGRVASRWPVHAIATWHSLWDWTSPAMPVSPRTTWLIRLCLAITLMLTANLAGLTFLGMEHGLQVLLAIACALGMMEAFAGRTIPVWCLVAAILGPSVRYENLALVAAIAIALVAQRRRLVAFLVVALSLIAPALFSFFLLSRGLSALPSSVLVKSKVYKFSAGPLVNALATVVRSVYLSAQTYAWYVQLAVLFLLLWLTLREKHRTRRLILAATALVALLQLLIGQFNWFYRYEIYALIFCALIAGAALEVLRIPYLALLTGLCLAAGHYTLAVYDIPAGASNVYQQQYQVHRFLDAYPQPSVAVNDLGWVSYHRPAGTYVLDLWGLASPVAARQYYKDAAWLEAITRGQHTGLAIVYPDWFDEGVPADWHALGTMCISSRAVTVNRECVVFFSTAVGNQAALQAQVDSFADTLPNSVDMTLGKDVSQDIY